MSRRKRDEAAFSLFSFQDIITSVTGIIILLTLLLAVELASRSAQLVSDVRPNADPSNLDIEINARQSKVALLRQELARLRKQSDVGLNLSVDGLERRKQLLDRKLALARQAIASNEMAIVRLRGQLEDARSSQEVEREQQIETVESDIKQLESELTEIADSTRLVFRPTSDASRRSWIVEIDGHGLLVGSLRERRPPRTFSGHRTFMGWLADTSSRADYFLLLVRPNGTKRFQALSQALNEAGVEYGFDLIGKGQYALSLDDGAFLVD